MKVGASPIRMKDRVLQDLQLRSTGLFFGLSNNTLTVIRAFKTLCPPSETERRILDESLMNAENKGGMTDRMV